MKRFVLVLTCTAWSMFATHIPALASTPIGGWQNLKFGMTQKEAFAATPDIKWSVPKNCTKNPDEGCEIIHESGGWLAIEGFDFLPASLRFDSHDRLVAIYVALHDGRKAGRKERSIPIDAEVCDTSFRKILAPLEREYGKFQYVGYLPEHPEKNPAYASSEAGTYFERMAAGDHHIKVTIVTTNLSEYEKALQELENRNVVYGSHVSLTGSHEKGRCKISIVYQSKPTSP